MRKSVPLHDHVISAVLEAELFNLRTRRPVHPQFNRTTRAQKARNTNVDIDDEEAVAAARAQQSRYQMKMLPHSHKKPQKKIPRHRHLLNHSRLMDWNTLID
jgi:hypothetical protein